MHNAIMEALGNLATRGYDYTPQFDDTSISGEEWGEEGSLIVCGLARRCLVPPPVRVHDGGDGARPRAWPDAGAVPG